MKLGKAMKKLKFWSRKNKKPKNNFKYSHYYPPPPLSPPLPPCQCRHSWPPPQPSAPPMPPWYVPDETDTNIYRSGSPALGRDCFDENSPEIGTSSYQQYFTPKKPNESHETDAHIHHPGGPVLGNACFDKIAPEIGTSAYQHYLVPEKLDETDTYIHHLGGPVLGNECFDRNAPEIGTSSNQQYLVEDPVYGELLLGPGKRKKSSGVFGCAVSISKHLIESLFGCFNIREK